MNAYFDILIEIGKIGNLPKKDYLIEHSMTERLFLSEDWKILNNEDLIYLFRGLVILEEYWFSAGIRIGSTTDTKFVYREIINRQLDNDYSIGNWAFVLSSNPYVPLDTGNRHGAQTIYEYLEWQSNYHDRIATEKIDADIRKEEKKRLKAEAHAERLRRKEIRDQELGYKK
jgi:hypothetical protein